MSLTADKHMKYSYMAGYFSLDLMKLATSLLTPIYLKYICKVLEAIHFCSNPY